MALLQTAIFSGAGCPHLLFIGYQKQKVMHWNLYDTDVNVKAFFRPKQQCSIRIHQFCIRVEGGVVARIKDFNLGDWR